MECPCCLARFITVACDCQQPACPDSGCFETSTSSVLDVRPTVARLRCTIVCLLIAVSREMTYALSIKSQMLILFMGVIFFIF